MATISQNNTTTNRKHQHQHWALRGVFGLRFGRPRMFEEDSYPLFWKAIWATKNEIKNTLHGCGCGYKATKQWRGTHKPTKIQCQQCGEVLQWDLTMAECMGRQFHIIWGDDWGKNNLNVVFRGDWWHACCKSTVWPKSFNLAYILLNWQFQLDYCYFSTNIFDLGYKILTFRFLVLCKYTCI